MSTKQFLTAIPGRIAAGALAVAIGGAGILILVGPGPATFITIPAVTLLAAAGFVVAIGAALDKFTSHVTGLVLLLPFVAGFYFAGMKTFIAIGAPVGIPLAVVGYLLAWFALRGYRFLLPPEERPRDEDEAPPQDDHAHSHH
jgi:hypothetical protein